MPDPAIIRYRFYHQEATGRRASISGAVPFTSNAEAEGWKVIEDGFTIRWPDGTTGWGHTRRRPFITELEAQTFIDMRPGFQGFSRQGD